MTKSADGPEPTERPDASQSETRPTRHRMALVVYEGAPEAEETRLLLEAKAADLSKMSMNVIFNHGTEPPFTGKTVDAALDEVAELCVQAVKKAGDAVKGAADRAVGTAKAAKAGVEIAGTIAKDEIGRASRKAAHSATKAADAVKSAPGKARDKAKKGIKGFIKRQAEKVVKRMSEENVENEGYQPMTPDRTARVDRAKKKAYDADHRAQYKGDSAEADKQFKRRMAMDSRTKMRKEELEVKINFYQEKAISVELPNQVNCLIESTDVALKGQTVSSSYKPAILDNGVKIQVPPFIESGDQILVDTRTIEYVKKI